MGWAPIMARITLPLLSSFGDRDEEQPCSGRCGRPFSSSTARAGRGCGRDARRIKGINLTKSEVVVPEALAACD